MPSSPPVRTAPEPPRAVPPPGAPPSPGTKQIQPKAVEDSGLFRALVAAGCDPEVAYTADQRTKLMISEVAAAQIQPALLEIREVQRKHTEQLAEHDRKLDILVTEMASLKVQMQMLLAAFGILVTVLIAVFGFLFAS